MKKTKTKYLISNEFEGNLLLVKLQDELKYLMKTELSPDKDLAIELTVAIMPTTIREYDE